MTGSEHQLTNLNLCRDYVVCTLVLRMLTLTIGVAFCLGYIGAGLTSVVSDCLGMVLYPCFSTRWISLLRREFTVNQNKDCCPSIGGVVQLKMVFCVCVCVCVCVCSFFVGIVCVYVCSHILLCVCVCVCVCFTVLLIIIIKIISIYLYVCTCALHIFFN